MPSERHQVKTYLNDEEKDRLDELAKQLRLSRSELLKRLVMGYRMPKPEDFVAWQGIRDLLKVNADLARLGNLFKLAIEETDDDSLSNKLESMITEIDETRSELKSCVVHIRDLVQPRKS